MTQSNNARCGMAWGNAPLECALPEPVTLALTEPIVGVGTPPASTKLCAFDASAAKPTEAGLARKTLYTFFRNVSPTIHAGELLFEVYSKIAPRHCPFESSVSLKSAGEMDQLLPPKERATLTVVEQAAEDCQHTKWQRILPMGQGGNVTTYDRCNILGNCQWQGKNWESAHIGH
jgi:hypothetical protein